MQSACQTVWSRVSAKSIVAIGATKSITIIMSRTNNNIRILILISLTFHKKRSWSLNYGGKKKDFDFSDLL